MCSSKEGGGGVDEGKSSLFLRVPVPTQTRLLRHIRKASVILQIGFPYAASEA